MHVEILITREIWIQLPLPSAKTFSFTSHRVTHANFETRQRVRENKCTLVASAQTYHFPSISEWNAHLLLRLQRRRTSWNRAEWAQEVKSNVVGRDWVIFTLLFLSRMELVREESKHRGYLFFSRWAPHWAGLRAQWRHSRASYRNERNRANKENWRLP